MTIETALELIFVSVMLLAMLGLLVTFVYLLYKENRRQAAFLRVEKLRSEAVTQWCLISQKIRNGEATMDDLERSFFLDDVMVRPQRYRLKKDGTFVRAKSDLL